MNLEQEEGRGTKKETLMGEEKHWLGASCTHPDRGLNPQPIYVPWPGIKPTTFWCTGWHSNQMSHLTKANPIFAPPCIQSAQEKSCQTRILYPTKLSFRNERCSFPEQWKLRKFITTGPAFQEMLKGVLWAETNGC